MRGGFDVAHVLLVRKWTPSYYVRTSDEMPFPLSDVFRPGRRLLNEMVLRRRIREIANAGDE